MNDDKSTVIDYTGNPKNAALYFDSIIPLSYSFILEHGSKFHNMKDFKTIFPLKMQDNEVFIDYVNLLKSLYDSVISYNIKGDTDGLRTNAVWDMFHINLALFLGNLKIKNYIILHKLNNDSHCTQSYECISLELAQLPLIDTNKSEWEQIIQIRRDKESIRKLKNLRLFFHENYSGKDKSFVKDDLCKKLEDYTNTVKDWGFETVTSSLTLINSSITSVGASLVLALTGNPLKVAASTGICVGIANMALHIAKEKYKLIKMGRDHPLAYIFEAKKKLEK